MGRLKCLRTVILTMLLMLIAMTPCLALKRVVPETTKDDIVNKYFKSRTLDSIEGIWSFTVNGYYGEVAIIKSPSDI